MMNSIEVIKQTLFTQWNLIRWIRLAIGIFIAVQAVQTYDALAGFLSFIFLFQAFTNTGCCGVSGCAVPRDDKNQSTSGVVEFEEVKGKK